MALVLSARQGTRLSGSQQNQYCRRLNQAVQDLLLSMSS